MEATEHLRRFAVARRHHLGLTQQGLNRASGLSMGWIGGLEAGKMASLPKARSLQRLADGLALDRETPGALFNFFQLLLAGTLTTERIQDVAVGACDAGTAMFEATRGVGVSTEELAAQQADGQAERIKRMNRALDILRYDLCARDYAILRGVIRSFYDTP